MADNNELEVEFKIGLSDEDKQQMADEIYDKVNDETQKKLVEMHETIYDTIEEMKNDSSTLKEMKVRTSGYFNVNDGGHATYFIREKNKDDIEDNGFIHFLNNGLVAELIIENEVNIKQLGIKDSEELDQTNLIQNAINKGVSLYIPNGTYRFTTLQLNSKMSIRGENREKTILKVLTSNEPSAITIPKGACVACFLSNITIEGGFINQGQNGLYIEARANENETLKHGGLWNSRFSNLIIQNFSGVVWGMIAPSKDNLLPIQSNMFEFINAITDCKLYPSSIPLLIQGQVEQCTFIRCVFTGKVPKEESALGTYGAVFKRYQYSDGSFDDMGGGILDFYSCYFGEVETAIYISRGICLNFHGIYFENTKRDALIDTSSNCCFDSCKYYGNSLDGTNVNVDFSSSVVVANSYQDNVIVSNFAVISNSPKLKIKKDWATMSLEEIITTNGRFVAISGTGTIKKFNLGQPYIILKALEAITIENNENIKTPTKTNYTLIQYNDYLIKNVAGYGELVVLEEIM